LKSHWKKIVTVLVSVLLIATVLSPAFDEDATNVTNDNFTQAMLVFGSAKALNGVISVAQGTEVGPPGITVAIGEILDPINDLVEQFSWVMLASMTSLGIQKILMQIVSATFFDALFILFVIASNVWIFYRFRNDIVARELFFKLAVVILFLRISIPLMTLANQTVYDYFVEPEYNITALEKSISTLTADVRPVTPKESSWLDKFDSDYYAEQIDHYTRLAENASTYIIQLIIVFIFQTILFPLLFLYLLYQLIKKLFGDLLTTR
jgi:hypothetical protein